MKHIELNYPSLAEAYAHAREFITLSDLGHKASIVIDIDTDSPYDGRFIKVAGTCEENKENKK